MRSSHSCIRACSPVASSPPSTRPWSACSAGRPWRSATPWRRTRAADGPRRRVRITPSRRMKVPTRTDERADSRQQTCRLAGTDDGAGRLPRCRRRTASDEDARPRPDRRPARPGRCGQVDAARRPGPELSRAGPADLHGHVAGRGQARLHPPARRRGDRGAPVPGVVARRVRGRARPPRRARRLRPLHLRRPAADHRLVALAEAALLLGARPPGPAAGPRADPGSSRRGRVRPQGRVHP